MGLAASMPDAVCRPAYMLPAGHRQAAGRAPACRQKAACVPPEGRSRPSSRRWHATPQDRDRPGSDIRMRWCRGLESQAS